jgi:hypothetical protein
MIVRADIRAQLAELAGELAQAKADLAKGGSLEGAFRDIVPNRLGIFMRYLVIRGPQGKNQVIGVHDIPAGRCPGEDRERLQIGIPCGCDLADGIVLGRFLAAGANSGESLIDPVLVALQAHLHRSVRFVPGETGEIVHDRLLLDHSPEADLLGEPRRAYLLSERGPDHVRLRRLFVEAGIITKKQRRKS